MGFRNHDWVGDHKVTVEYDANGNETGGTEYSWDIATNNWIGYIYWVYEYDSNGNLIMRIEFFWDTETNDWMEGAHRTYTYNAHGDITEDIAYIWDFETNEWYGYSRKTVEYDANGHEIEALHYDWDSGTKDWILERKMVSYWSELNTSVSNDGFDLDVVIYPNPAKDIITIAADLFDHYYIHITSMNGQLMYGAELEGTSIQVDLSSFYKGIYFITIRSKDNVAIRKILKL